MEIGLEEQDWPAAERAADALEAYSRPEPIPRRDFFVARGRALGAHGRGQRDKETIDALAAPRDEAPRGLDNIRPALDRALAGR